MLLLDTNIFVEILLGSSLGRECAQKIEALQGEELAYSAITWFELWVKEGQREAAQDLLHGFRAIPLTLLIAQEAAEIYGRHFHKNRRKIPDALIAATAMTSGATLWTMNRTDFKRVPRLKLFP